MPPRCTLLDDDEDFPMSGATTFQDGQLTLRLASLCALQVIWVALVQYLSWQLTRPAPCSAACPCGGHLAFRLASTVRRFGASTSPISSGISTARKLQWGHPSMAGVLSGHALHASPESSTPRRSPRVRGGMHRNHLVRFDAGIG
jgi:hypothetical protein